MPIIAIAAAIAILIVALSAGGFMMSKGVASIIDVATPIVFIVTIGAAYFAFFKSKKGKNDDENNK